jgi:hypothetical protein
MRRSVLNTLLATAGLIALGALAASEVAARLSVIPGRPGAPRPTSSQSAPTPAPTAPAGAGVGACQALIAAESDLMLGALRAALGTCLARGVACLVEQNGSSACCEESALLCQGNLNQIAAATRRFRDTVRGGSCSALPLERLVAEDGLGFAAPACGSLVTPIEVVDHASFADCLQLLLTKDVLHQVGLTDLPRAPEALVCMGLDEVLAAALGVDPATCLPTPSPTPEATPIPTHSPVPTPSPTPAGPTPIPTPSPGPDGCQPRLFGPCADAPFTGCCQAERHCAFIIGEDGPGFCIADPPSSTATPAPSATPAATLTGAPTTTPTPGATGTPEPTATPGPTAPPTATPPPTGTPAPTGSPGEPTATPGPTATPEPTAVATCQTATVTITTSYQAQTPPDVVAGVSTFLDYPGTRLEIPGTGNQSTVLARVTNLSGVSALFSAGDQDSDSDGADDRVSVGLISTGAAIPPGTFAQVVFDCIAGEALPVAADFTCTPDVSSLFGNTLEATCEVSVVSTP